MKKTLLTCTLIALLASCAEENIPYATLRREHKENRFKQQFHKADSMFNVKYKVR